MRNKIEEVLMQKAISEYEKVLFTKPHASQQYGTFPDKIIIKYFQCSLTKAYLYKSKSLVDVWKYENGKVYKQDAEVDEDLVIDGMFYNVATIWLGYDSEKKIAVINYVFGPRFGREYCYDVILNGEQILLEHERLISIS